MPLLGQDNSWTRQRHAISMRNKHCYHRDYHHVFSFPIQVLLTNYRDTRKSNLKFLYCKRTLYEERFLKG